MSEESDVELDMDLVLSEPDPDEPHEMGDPNKKGKTRGCSVRNSNKDEMHVWLEEITLNHFLVTTILKILNASKICYLISHKQCSGSGTVGSV
jgi:hypothetical protein